MSSTQKPSQFHFLFRCLDWLKSNMKPFILILFITAVGMTLLIESKTFANKEDQSLSPEDWLKKAEQTRVEMQALSKELNVTCNECHNPSNFKSDEKKAFKISKDHMITIETLRKQGFDGKKYALATCTTCHKGHLKIEAEKH